MRCHYIYDKDAGKVHIPGCYGAAIFGEDHCSCYNKGKIEPSEKSNDKKLIRELEKENARLNRIIKKLLNTPKVIKDKLPSICRDKKRGKDYPCKYPLGTCQLCRNEF